MFHIFLLRDKDINKNTKNKKIENFVNQISYIDTLLFLFAIIESEVAAERYLYMNNLPSCHAVTTLY